MKRIIIALLLLTCLAAFNITDNSKVFKKLYSLKGTWKMNTRRGPLYEEWRMVDKDNLLGRGYMVSGKDTIINERVALTNTAEGIFYNPTVMDEPAAQGADKKPVVFKLTKAERKTFVFENREHDFPKRIVYKFITSDSLHAYIDDGTETGKRQNYYYKRQ